VLLGPARLTFPLSELELRIESSESKEMGETDEGTGSWAAPLWLLCLYCGVVLAAPVVMLGAWAIWLVNHRMGPLPVWLTTTTMACSAVLWSARLVARWADKRSRV
jgi:hypothetical protein